MHHGRGYGGAADVAALAAQSLASAGRLRLRVTGASMLPLLRPGDELRVEACSATDVGDGDIVLSLREGRMVAHRVVGRCADGIVTQGDALPHRDPPCAPSDVLGRLAGFSRGSSYHEVRPLRGNERLGRWLFRRSELATRMFLRWHHLRRRRAV